MQIIVFLMNYFHYIGYFYTHFQEVVVRFLEDFWLKLCTEIACLCY